MSERLKRNSASKALEAVKTTVTRRLSGQRSARSRSSANPLFLEITFVNGIVKLKNLPEAEFKALFHRLPADDELNYWNVQKQAKSGNQGEIIRVYDDQTVTILFEGGEQWNYPFETIEKQISISPEIDVDTLPKFVKGRVRLQEFPQEEVGKFKRLFDRFAGDELNYWNVHKQEYAGLEGEVLEVYDDFTVTMWFDDGAVWDFPFECLSVQVNDIPTFVGERARLQDLPAKEFEELFARFPKDDDVNYWSAEKQTYAGRTGEITSVFGDATVTMTFSDGVEFDFPFEAIAPVELPATVEEVDHLA